MRPVNLIPPEQRRGDRAPLRTGKLSYVVVGALAVALLAVTGVVMTGNTISERGNELDGLKAEEQSLSAQAEALKPYANFVSVQQARRATVTSLAQSRFDWERVFRELAIVLPKNVSLIKMSGTVSPAVSMDGAAEVPVREEVQAPAISMIGCTADQEAVAKLVASLKDIDGVTRVTVQESRRPELSNNTNGSQSGPPGESGDDCRSKDTVTRFALVMAFDDVPTPTAATAAVPGAPAAVPGAVGATPVSAPAAATTDSGVSSAQSQERQAKDSIANQTAKARRAVNLVPGVAK